MSHPKKAADVVSNLASDKGLRAETSTDPILSIDMSSLDRELQRKEIESRDESLKDRRQDREQRKTFSTLIFKFMCAYMFLSLAIVFFCGFGWMCLSEAVLIALLTTTLANVIGVFNFVAKYLFHK